MRKLRKKIYKFTNSKNYPKQHYEPTHDVFEILTNRQVPDFLIDILKKKRNFDFTAIKNIVVASEISLFEMNSLVNKQEMEIK
jgi:hypothetical protein